MTTTAQAPAAAPTRRERAAAREAGYSARQWGEPRVAPGSGPAARAWLRGWDEADGYVVNCHLNPPGAPPAPPPRRPDVPYQISATYPTYDGRDAPTGTASRRAVEYTYETYALARAVASRMNRRDYEEGGDAPYSAHPVGVHPLGSWREPGWPAPDPTWDEVPF